MFRNIGPSTFRHFILQHDFCPCCGSRSLRRFRRKAADADGIVSLIHCRSCDLAWQWPIARKFADSMAFFDESYRDAGKNTTNYFDPDRRRRVAELEMDFVRDNAPHALTMLDVGAGDGALVNEAAKRGLKVVGIEPSLEACNRFKPANEAAEMVHGTLDDVGPKATFDLLTLMDVIEHIDEPLQILAKAKQHLREDGVLVIETGNFLSLNRVEEEQSWWCYQWDHRWYFSPPTMERLLRAAGFAPYQLASRVLRPEWRERPRYLGPSRARLLSEVAGQPLSAGRVWRRYLDLRRCAIEWAEWSRLNIFTMAARHAEAPS